MKKSGLLFASTSLAILLVSGVAWAQLPPPPGANWQMNETEGQMRDESGNGNHGTPTDVLQTGPTSGYLFNGSTSRVVVPDDDSLNPQANDITLEARVMVTNKSMDDDSYDVVRKGLSTTAGGDYKMEIKRVKANPTVGKLRCEFIGTGGRVYKANNRDVVDGNWHTLRCAKTGNSVVATVDGRSATKTGSAGSITNASNLMVGGKEVTPRPDDMFDGAMDFVRIDIAQPAPQ